MKASVKILTTPTVDTPGTTVMLICDDQRYLFGNLGEGSQRVAIENDWKLSKITSLFLSGQMDWKSIGGLLGTILTLADSLQGAAEAKGPAKTTPTVGNGNVDAANAVPEKKRLKLYGGPNLTHMLATARKFIFRKGVPLDVDELDDTVAHPRSQPIWSNKHIRVWAMGVKPTTQKQSPSTSPPLSPRKRSFDEFREHADVEGHLDNKTNRDQNLRICKAVVSDMFDSDWRYDALVEMPLSQVQALANVPATVFVRNPDTRGLEKFRIPDQDSTGPAPSPDMKVLVRKPWPAAGTSELPHTAPSTTATSYFVRCQTQRGKFLIAKAKALGIRPGPVYEELTQGKSILLPDGREVHSKDVLGPDVPGNGFAVIDLPSPLHVKDLIEKTEWKNSEIMDGLRFVVWILGPNVRKNDEFRAFLAFLKTMHNVTNIISSPNFGASGFAFKSVATTTHRLRQIDQHRFPQLKHSDGNSVPTGNYLVPDLASVANRGWTWDLHPMSLPQREPMTLNIEKASLSEELPPEIRGLADAARNEVQSLESRRKVRSQRLPGAEAEIIFLGTGSAQPSKYRNVSGTLLRVPGYGSYLFDCGENTLGQLRRMYTEDEVAEILRDLRVIWISHLHADHHLGTVSVIKAWHRAVHGNSFISLDEHKANIAAEPIDPLEALRETKRLFIASCSAMNRWLAEYASIEDYGYDKLITLDVIAMNPSRKTPTRIMWGNRNVTFNTSSAEMRHAMRVATGLVMLDAAYVEHCAGSLAVALTFSNGFKVAFSGDCRPSKEFALVGKGSTVLIHEATFDDQLHGDALAKKHSTVSEAIGVGMAMGARRILLTHFSQRYQKIPLMPSVEAKAEDLFKQMDDGSPGLKNIGVAHGSSSKSNTEPMADHQTVGTVGDSLSWSSASPNETFRSSDSDHNLDAVDLSDSESTQKGIADDLQKRHTDVHVAVAFDYMHVKVRDIILLEKFTPPIVALLEHYEKEKGEGKERNKAITIDREKRKAKKMNAKLKGADRKRSLDTPISALTQSTKGSNIGRQTWKAGNAKAGKVVDDERILKVKDDGLERAATKQATKLKERVEPIQREEREVQGVEKPDDQVMMGTKGERGIVEEDWTPRQVRREDFSVPHVAIEKTAGSEPTMTDETKKQINGKGVDNESDAPATSSERMEANSEAPKPLQATR